MGLLDKIFGRKKAPSGGGDGSLSLAASLAQQHETLTPKPCDICGSTYLSSEAQVCILSASTPDMRLDIGGYCPRCRKQLCQRHLAFDHVTPSPLSDPGKLKDTSYGVVCESCGSRVRHDRNGEPARFVTIITIDAKSLKPARPRPAAQVAAPSGKFSLHKIILVMTPPADLELEPVPSMICMQCFALHPHPMPTPVFGFDVFKKMGYDVSADDFEVDIGADCPTCGVICGKHIVLKGITVEGAKYLALHCATHNERLG